MKKNILVMLVVVVVLGGGYMAWRNSAPVASPASATTQNSTSSPQPPVQSGTTYTVVYTDQGYEGESLTIKTGDSVTFTNRSTHDMMTAFGEHATHDEYPDKKAHPTLGMGMSDTIMFPTAGTFDYHNHHAEDDTGSIVVQ